MDLHDNTGHYVDGHNHDTHGEVAQHDEDDDDCGGGAGTDVHPLLRYLCQIVSAVIFFQSN